MKLKIRMYFWLCVAVMLMLSLPGATAAVPELSQHTHKAQSSYSPAEKRTIAAFEKRVKDYVKLRNRIKTKIPKLSKDSTPEQIAAFEKASVEGMRSARASAKRGDLFFPEAAALLRATLKIEFKPSEKKEIRKVVLGAEAASAPLRVNYPYPDAMEFVEMPVKVLLILPPLPREIKYRYVGRNLLLVDSDNNLIVDYMLDALP